MLTLFPDERIITESNEQSVILTTHRICYEKQEWGNSYNQSIMLEHITSCENRSKNKYWLIIIAGFAIAIGLFNATINNNEGILGVCLLIALLLGLLFQFTKKNLIIIGSPSTKMVINVKGMHKDTVLSFINKIEQAKHTRLTTLNQNK